MKIPRLMSTQHPDNITTPFFAKETIIAGDDEIKEAFYAFSHLKVTEQLWDAEGKEVDNFVVEKLFTRYESYFKENELGKDNFLTLRVPNPDVEKTQGKILLESLNSIPRSYDLAKKFYENEAIPVFEVVIPMCASEKPLIRLHQYYKNHIIEEQNKPIYNNDIPIKEWLGKFGPPDIRVTPLYETKDAILNADEYTKKYIESEKIKEFQRVWFARSDPALNYSSAAAVLIEKIGLLKLHDLQEKMSIDIYPIIGCGASPFRGNFKPTNVKDMVREYPSMQTFTIQSAFKYDYPIKQVIEGIEEIKNTKRQAPLYIDTDKANSYIEKMEEDYVQIIKLVAPIIKLMSKHIPQRRKRKLHIGLFGYSRSTKGITLPRAIKFCASLYSLGMPPELFGLAKLKEKEIDNIRQFYRGMDNDLADALQYYNKDNLSYFPPEVQKKVKKVLKIFSYETDEEHKKTTSEILKALKKQDIMGIQEGVIKAGHIRQFLG